MQRNILEYLERTAGRVPDKIAFSDETQGLTFRQVLDQSRAIGSRLAGDGFYKRPVVVFMQKQPKTIAAFLGVIYSGCYYVPLDPEMPQQRIALILQNLQSAACICDETTASIAAELEHTGRLYCYDTISSEPIDSGPLQSIRDRQIDTDLIYIVFTSGSTGVPKGVAGCHRSVIDYIENLCDVLKFDEDTRFGNQSPLYFDACLKEILPTLKLGAATQLIPRKLFLMPVRLVEYLNAHRINTLCWVVSALTFISFLNTFKRVKPEYLRTIAFASEVFPIRQLKRWRQALPDARFINLYGPTETTGICCYYEVDREFAEDEVLPVGRPFPNTEILLLNDQNQPAAIGEQGEICIRGTRLTHGYYDSPEKTAQGFVQNPLNPHYPELIYRTGDLGIYNDRGELVFLCRKDNQIKHMGHRIELGEIEVAANSLDSVHTACCVYDPEHSHIMLYYTGQLPEDALAGFLREKLPRYMLPHRFCHLETMPLTPNGKIDRNSLAQRRSTTCTI